jgi:hypothetical protein
MCSVEGCNKKAVCRGWCNRHYQKWYKYGDPYEGESYENGRSGDNNSNYRGGISKHPLRDCYDQMIARCYTPSHTRYFDYGGRGITVCIEWQQDFLQFVKDIGERPEGMWLDRKDNDGPYSPENCRWVTPSTSNYNRRTSGWEYRERDSSGRFL